MLSLSIVIYGTGPLAHHGHHTRHPEVDAISLASLSDSKRHGLGAEPSDWLKRCVSDSELDFPSLDGRELIKYLVKAAVRNR